MIDMIKKNHNNQDNHSKITVQTNRQKQSSGFAFLLNREMAGQSPQ
jgi:hypothetical protein